MSGEAEPIESRSEDSVKSTVKRAGCMSQLSVLVCGESALQWQEDSANQQVGGASEFRAASAPAYSHGNGNVKCTLNPDRHPCSPDFISTYYLGDESLRNHALLLQCTLSLVDCFWYRYIMLAHASECKRGEERERRPRALAGLTHDAPIGSQAQIGKPVLSVSLSRRVPSQAWNAARWLIYFRMLGYCL